MSEDARPADESTAPENNLPVLSPAASPREDIAARHLVRTVAGTIVTGSVLIFMLDYAEEILAPLTLAILINLVLGPWVRGLRRWHVPRPLGAFLVLSLVASSLFGIAVLAAPSVQRWAGEVPSTLAAIQKRLLKRDAFETILNASRQADATADLMNNNDTVSVEIAPSGAPAWLVQGTGVLVNLVFVLVLAFLMLSAGDRFRERTRSIFEGSPLRKRVRAATLDIETSVSTYVTTIAAINVGLGIVVGLAMWAVGLDDPLLWGAVAGLCNFVPYVGPLVTLSLIAIAAFTSFGTLSGVALAALTYLGINAIEAFVVTPVVLGRRLQLSPVATLIAVLFWGWLWGLSGALVAIPSLVVTYCICAQILPLRPVAMLLAR